jgi:hypothetical protein
MQGQPQRTAAMTDKIPLLPLPRKALELMLNANAAKIALLEADLARKAASADRLVSVLEKWEQRYQAVPDWRLRPNSDDQDFVVALNETRQALTEHRSQL